MNKKFYERLRKAKELKVEELFYNGALALREELDMFIDEQLKGERGDAFSQGQDDGLRWIKDHLAFIFDEKF